MSATAASPGIAIGRSALGWGLAAIVLVLLPYLFRSDSAISLMCGVGIAVIFAASYNILLGQTGLLSFGHAVFYGLGGFGAIHAMNAIIASGLPIPLVMVPLIGGCTGLLFGVLFGSLASKRGGIVFAMITFGLGELVSSIAPIMNRFFGGDSGITTDRSRLYPLFGFDFGAQIQVYYLIAAWCLISLAAIRYLGRTAFGQVASAARDNAERVEFIGYSIRHVRFTAFCLASFFAGIAGALTAINFEIMTVLNVGAQQSTMIVLATYIGGIDFFAGPIIGGVLITLMQSSLSDITPGWQLYLGLAFVLVVMYAPGGIAGLLFSTAAGETLADRLAPRRLVLLVPMLAIVVGGILAIELGYQLGEGSGTVRRFLGIGFDAAQVWLWMVAVVLVLVGGTVLARTARQ